MRRPAIVLSALAVALGGVLVFVATFDWSTLRGAVERGFTARTGRALSIGGALTVHLWPPSVVAEEVRITNPPWARLPLRAARLVCPSISALLQGRLAAGELSLAEPVVSLEVRGDARTWVMGKSPQPRAAASFIDCIRIDRGRIEFLDAHQHRNSRGRQPAAEPGKQGASVRGRGRIQGEAVELEASGPEALPLADASLPIAVRGRLRAGATQIRLKGAVAGVPTPKFANVEIFLVGEDLIALLRAFGALPDKPFDRERLQRMDVDVTFKAKPVWHPPALPIERCRRAWG